MKYDKLLINPYILYSIIWLTVLVLYSFHWTYLFPSISPGLLIFILSTSLISLLWGLHKNKQNSFSINRFLPTLKHYFFAKKISLFAMMFMAVEFVIYRNIPLVSYVIGSADAGLYKEFGVPFIHVIAVNLFLFMEFFLFFCYMLSNERSLKTKFLKLFFLNFVVLSLLMNRAVLMYVILGAILIFCIIKRKILKYFSFILLFLLGVLFLFGMLGNIRNGGDNETGKKYILNLCEATPEFENSFVPAELFWPYIYVTSPISNVEFTIRRTHPNINVDNFISFCVNECTPQLISKRLDVEHKTGKLVLDSLNVGSVYMNAYACLGWLGMVLMFLFMFLFIEINTRLISVSNIFFPCLLVLIDIVIIFNIFDNMFIFSGIIPAILVTLFFSFVKLKF